MFAVYATHAAPHDPLSALEIGCRPEHEVPDGWVRVRQSLQFEPSRSVHAPGGQWSPEGIRFPIILGNDGAALSMTARRWLSIP